MLRVAASLQVSRDEDRDYTEIADALRTPGGAPTNDARQLWRRPVLNLLITNVNDYLQNYGARSVRESAMPEWLCIRSQVLCAWRLVFFDGAVVAD